MKPRHLALPVGLFCIATLFAHDDLFEEDRQPPYVGPGMLNPDTGRAILNFPAENVTLLAWLPIPDLDPTAFAANDCWGYVSPSGREYALIGTSGATNFVDVTNPGEPRLIASLPGLQTSWRDIKTFEDHAYSVDESGGGIQVFDLSRIDEGVVTQTNEIVDTHGTPASHNVAIDTASGFLYRVGGGVDPIEGLRIYDLTDKDDPQFVTTWDDRYVHDAQVVTYTDGPFAGRQIAFCFAEDTAGGINPGVDILDVTDKSNIFMVSQVFYPGIFSHQGWISEDRQYLYFNDEIDELAFGIQSTTRVVDISDLNNPFLAADFTTGSTSIDHNLYVHDGHIFEANYRSGLHVFDASDPLAPVRVAFFDTYMEDDFANFNGLWSCYPFFPSGTVIGSDIEKGLFVWRVGPAPIQFEFPAEPTTMVANRGGKLSVDISEVADGALVRGTPTLHVDMGNGFEAIRMHKGRGNSFVGNLPKADCGQEVRYFFSAGTPDGVTWREPQGAPMAYHVATVADARDVHLRDDFEVDTGWIAGDPDDSATTGIWELGDPIGTPAQPEDDISPDPGVQCWVTGNGGTSLGDDDVDGGATTLISPRLDGTIAPDGILSYWRWYSNSQGSAPFEDILVVQISNDDGQTWFELETVGPFGNEVSGGWIQARFVLADVIEPTDSIRLRFIASDLFNGSIVEAAIDDLEISTFSCQRGGSRR